MSEFIKPNNINEEIMLDPNKVLMCKTDKKGVFEFANDYFIEVSGYEEYELMGKSMFCIQHPDMPEVIFKMMWEKLLSKKDFHVVVKNLAKNGRYYWSIINFTFKEDSKGEIASIYSKRKAANEKSKDFFSKLYKTLLVLEKKNGVGASERYMIGFLEERQIDFQTLVKSFHSDKLFDVDSNKVKTQVKPKSVNTSVIKEKKAVNIKGIEERINTLSNDSLEIKKTKSKKGLFQKLFGKTDEEIAEENRRKGKK